MRCLALGEVSSVLILFPLSALQVSDTDEIAHDSSSAPSSGKNEINRRFSSKYPSSWKDCRKLKVTELKNLCHDLELPLEGRKEDLLDRVTSALNISKSGSLEPKSEHYAVSSFDTEKC